MNEHESLMQTFIAECRDLLESMEESLLRIEAEPDSTETIHSLFRAAHTIKGSAGIFRFDELVAFAHVLESVLSRLRDKALAVTPTLIADLLPCKDHIAEMVETVAAGEGFPPALIEAGRQLSGRLSQYLPSGEATPPAVTKIDVGGAGAASAQLAPMKMSGAWHISLRLGRDCLRSGMDPLALIRYLGGIGEIAGIVTIDDGLPGLAEMDPESCYLGFEIELKSDAGRAAIDEAFEFVRDTGIVHVLPPSSPVSRYIELIRALPEEDMRLGEILVNSGVITQRDLQDGLRQQHEERRSGGGAPNHIGETLVERHDIPQPIVDAALAKQRQVREKRAEQSSIRVAPARLDQLVNLVGELVIACAGVHTRARRIGDVELSEATGSVMGLIEEMRDHVLQLRMVPIASTFGRFQRVVHDVSAELGKDIELVVTGGETEIDKSVAERIADPLLHLVRNAIDHGIEPIADRVAQGKPPRGTLRLNAYHDSCSMVIEISDDGGGIDRRRVLAKAVERGLVAPDKTLTDKEIVELIFEPGFSTAEQVTNLSGRGVGMDVVKRNITALRGTIDVQSREGTGTCMSIRLPLTLAIIDGFLVRIGSSIFVVPLEYVIECLELDESGQDAYMSLREEILPFLRLRQIFGVDGGPGRRQNVLVVQCGRVKSGLVVDELLGEFQTVIKPLGGLFNHIRGISGSTILGDGRVALILDVPALMRHVAELRSCVPMQVAEKAA